MPAVAAEKGKGFHGGLRSMACKFELDKTNYVFTGFRAESFSSRTGMKTSPTVINDNEKVRELLSSNYLMVLFRKKESYAMKL
jgi:hypothetical protein